MFYIFQSAGELDRDPRLGLGRARPNSAAASNIDGGESDLVYHGEWRLVGYGLRLARFD